MWGFRAAYTVRSVNWLTGHDNSTCWKGTIPCKNLAYALEELHNNTVVLLELGYVSHSSTSTVQGPISNITVKSSHSNVTTVINCFEHGGFAFTKVSELIIANVEFHGCGALHNSTSYDESGESTPYMMSLYLYNCTDVSLISINVSYSPGAGVVMLAVRGRVNVTDSAFFHNGFQITHNGSYINESALIGRLAGGGLKIELPSCPPGVNSVDCNGNNDICPSEGSLLPRYADVVYNIEKCSFISNTAEAPNFDTYRFSNFPDTSYFTTIGRGGGVSIVVKGVSHGISIAVTSCHFEDNWSLYGAGLFMELWHRPDNVSLTITDSNFTRNHLPYSSMQNIGTGGGGLRYAHQYCPEHQREGNTVIINGCNFIDNSAYWGGGVSLVLLPQQNILQNNPVLFLSSSFVGNVARFGAAADFAPKSNIHAPRAMLQDMQFVNNRVKYADRQSYINGEGIVYMYSTTLYVNSSLSILSNEGNGISSLYSKIHFLKGSTSLFYNNSAYRGAALALYGSAAILLHNGSQLNFTENKADTLGGAIYHAALGNRAVLFSGNCPIKLADGATDWNDTDVTLYFINNEVTQGASGNSIYISSFLPCVQKNLDEVNDMFKWRAFRYECDNVTNPNCTDHQVSGDGSTVELTKHFNLSITAFPGEQCPLPFNVEDDLHNKVQVHFQGEVYDYNSTYPVEVLNGRSVFVTGRPEKNARLQLLSTESQILSVLVWLNITECPPGFLLQNNSEGAWVCQCASRALLAYIGISCDPNDMTSKLIHNYWIGYLTAASDSNASIGFQSGRCPLGFCHSQSLTLKGSNHYNSASLDEKVCGPQNRTGVLCGNCKDGYGVSVLLNKWFQCVPCAESSSTDSFKVVVIWFFTEFVPLNIVLILFIVFNVNILSGWGGALYGVIFYFQIVPSTPPFQYQAPSGTDELSATDWYGWSLYINGFLSNLWNLMFFSAFIPLKDACVSKTTTVQGAILLTYLLILLWPVTVYSCLIAIHKCYHHGYCCRPAHKCLFRVGKLLAKFQHAEGGGVNSLAGLCSFFVLIYTKLVLLTWGICGGSRIQYSNDEFRYVFLYNGNVPWFDPKLHAPYAVPILLCSIVTVLIPTLLLVSFPLVPRLLVKLNLHERRPFRWIISLLSTSYLTFLFDIFQGCFKPNTRYFAALYLIYRHLFVFVWSFLGWFVMSFGVYQSVLGLTFIMLHLLAQPFASNAVNRITGLVMVNLTVVIILSQWIILLEQEFEIAQLAPVKILIIVLLYIPHFAVAIRFTWVIVQYIYRRIMQRCASKGTTPIRQGSSAEHELEESGRHRNVDDWDAVRHLCERTAAGWGETHSNREGTGYVQLEEEEEEEREEDEGEGEEDGKDSDRLVGQMQIQQQRHATSIGRKMHAGYGSLADYSKTQ